MHLSHSTQGKGHHPPQSVRVVRPQEGKVHLWNQGGHDQCQLNSEGNCKYSHS